MYKSGDEVLVYIIVLNWNGCSDTMRCLESLAGLDYQPYRILVVDNASSDDSVDRIRATFPYVELLKLASNMGYAGGNNRGIHYARDHGAGYIWILNNDTIATADSLSALVSAAQAFDNVGIVGGASIESACGWNPCIFPSAFVVDNWNSMHPQDIGIPIDRHPVPVDIAGGPSILLARAFFMNHEFDESFFHLYEDWDICLSARLSGFSVVFAPSSTVAHVGGHSLGHASPQYFYYFWRNHLLFVSKFSHLPSWRHFLRFDLITTLRVLLGPTRIRKRESLKQRVGHALGIFHGLVGVSGHKNILQHPLLLRAQVFAPSFFQED